MTLLIIFSITGCAKKEPPPKPTAKVETEEVTEKIATFHLAGFTTGGQKKWSVDGKSADIVSELVYLTEISTYFYSSDTTVHLTSDRGTFNKATGNIHLEGSVLATTDNGARLVTTTLDWDAKEEVMTTRDIVSVERDKLFVIGLGGMAKPNLSKAVFFKKVHVTVKPDAVITCKGPLEVDYRKSIATFKGDVKAVDARGEVYGDIVKVRFDSKGEGIISVHAWGNVRIIKGTDTSYSEEAIYETKIGRLLLTGRPKLVMYRKK